MTSSIHHINFIVRDLEQAIERWEQVLGQRVSRRDELVERGVQIGRFKLGDAWLVLVQPVSEDSAPGRFLAAHGEGFFLLSIGVDSLDAALERLAEGATAGPARQGLDNWVVQDLATELTNGALVQFCEEREPG